MAVGVNARTAFSLLFPPILEEFGWERGLTAGAFAVGFVIFPWLRGLIVARGWRSACVAVAVLVFALLPLIMLQRRRPQELGLVPDGDAAAHAADTARAHPANVVDPAWAAIEWTPARAMK